MGGAIALTLTLCGCATTGTVAGGRPVPKPFPMPPSRGQAPAETPTAAPTITEGQSPDEGHPANVFDMYALVGTALQLRGVHYRDGGADPRGFDCSGFTQYVFRQHGLALPRAVRDQFAKGAPVNPDEIEAGDLLFFSISTPGPSHVAIAVGSDEFVHAPSAAGVVRVERLSARYWAQRFVGARRLS
jgi:cell wall-associated NlpC family hydrolase